MTGILILLTSVVKLISTVVCLHSLPTRCVIIFMIAGYTDYVDFNEFLSYEIELLDLCTTVEYRIIYMKGLSALSQSQTSVNALKNRLTALKYVSCSSVSRRLLVRPSMCILCCALTVKYLVNTEHFVTVKRAVTAKLLNAL